MLTNTVIQKYRRKQNIFFPVIPFVKIITINRYKLLQNLMGWFLFYIKRDHTR